MSQCTVLTINPPKTFVMSHSAACQVRDLSMTKSGINRIRFRQSQSNQTCTFHHTDVWIGLSTLVPSECTCNAGGSAADCQACRAKYTWLEGDVTTPSYTNWVPTEPGDHENCVRMAKREGGWAGYKCSRRLKPVCEIGM